MSFMTVAKKVAKDIFTENDGQSYCPVRVIGGVLVVPAILLLLLAGGWRMATGALTLMEFSQAVSVMAGVVGLVFGAAVSIKAMTDKPLS